MAVLERLEWPGGVFNPDTAGRVLRELDSSGNAVYVGYAPRPDSPTDVPGWVIEYNVYNASNKLLTTYRRAGLTWNSHYDILEHVFPLDIPPAVGSIGIGAEAHPVIYGRGTAVGSVTLRQIGVVDGATKLKVGKAFGAVSMAILRAKSNLISPVTGVFRLSMSARVTGTPHKFARAKAQIGIDGWVGFVGPYNMPDEGRGGIGIAAFAQANRIVSPPVGGCVSVVAQVHPVNYGRGTAVGQVSMAGVATATKV